jgi:hypothetical protein
MHIGVDKKAAGTGSVWRRRPYEVSCAALRLRENAPVSRSSVRLGFLFEQSVPRRSPAAVVTAVVSGAVSLHSDGRWRRRCDRYGRGHRPDEHRWCHRQVGEGRARPCRALATVARRSARRSHFVLCGPLRRVQGVIGAPAMKSRSGSPDWSPDTASRGVIVDRLAGDRAVGRRSSSARP